MKIQIVSDLHLEFGPIEIKNAGADVLVLSGDICVANSINEQEIKDFFKGISQEFSHVVYVMGNHEHYHSDIQESKKIITDMFQELDLKNIYFLENESVKINDVVFAGATLWTDCNKEDPVTLLMLRRWMNDYIVVKNGKNRLMPNDTVDFHKETLNFFQKIVAESEKVVIVGHHAPSRASTHPRYQKEIIVNGAYSSDLSNFILDNPKIKVWTHGHTHDSFDYMIGPTRIVCNPRGYCGVSQNPDFDACKVIEI